LRKIVLLTKKREIFKSVNTPDDDWCIADSYYIECNFLTEDQKEIINIWSGFVA